MNERHRRHARLEAGAAFVTAALCLLNVTVPAWIEGILPFDPDAGSGTTEWAITLCLAAITIVSTVASWRTYRKLSASAATGDA